MTEDPTTWNNPSDPDSPSASFVWEQEKAIPVLGSYDVVVCGGGPAGICAALAAAREGASTLLIEAQGCLGGVWTSGLLSLILDAGGKGGILQEIQQRLKQRNALCDSWLYDAEEMKALLEEMVEEAGVEWLLHTRLTAVSVVNGVLEHVFVENKSGRCAYEAKVFVDATGDGDLAFLAGCEFEYGDPEHHIGQPMTLMAIVDGVPAEIETDTGLHSTFLPKEVFREMLLQAGHKPSYSRPSLFALPGGLFCLMIHHGYEYSGLNARDITRATREGRAEIMRATRKLRETLPGWERLRVVATANHVGVREGRRIRGVYKLTKEEVQGGQLFEDAVCHVTFPVDVHSLRKVDGGGYGNTGVVSRPYDIPYRALIAANIQNLLLAGRCISGDFYAHASYRVTGNACATGEAAGRSAAFCAAQSLSPSEIVWRDGRPVTKREAENLQGVESQENPFRKVPASGFTLLELLVVISVVFILAALSIPVIQRVQVSVNAGKCAANLRQIGVLFHSYLQDNEGKFPFSIAPGEGSWDYKLVAYSSSPENARAVGEAAGKPYGVFACPSSKKPVRSNAVASSYAINQNLVGIHNAGMNPTPTAMRLSRIANPSQTYLIMDSDGREFRKAESVRTAFTTVRYGDVSAVERHKGRLNMLFVDGSVRALSLDEMAWGEEYLPTAAPWGPE